MANKDEIRTFSILIEKLSKEKRIGYMEAILHHCEITGLEVEVAATLITAPLKAKISEEAQELNMLKKQPKLPI
jgi:hypothetical protein